jgi:hypothetical protein
LTIIKRWIEFKVVIEATDLWLWCRGRVHRRILRKR